MFRRELGHSGPEFPVFEGIRECLTVIDGAKLVGLYDPPGSEPGVQLGNRVQKVIDDAMWLEIEKLNMVDPNMPPADQYDLASIILNQSDFTIPAQDIEPSEIVDLWRRFRPTDRLNHPLIFRQIGKMVRQLSDE
jgi:hypothetical protein